MPIPLADARQLIRDLGSADLGQLVSQAEAQHILFEVGEAAENFPPVTEGLEDRITALAYLYLAAGCSVVEQGQREEGNVALERGARLLRSIHGPHARTSRDSAFHILIAAMAAYSTGQYSWAFVLLQDVERYAAAATVIACFLRRERRALQVSIAAVLYEAAPTADTAPRDAIEIGIERAIARGVALAAEFLYSGHRQRMEQARIELRDATELAFEGSSPGWWLVARLLGLMIGDLEGSSPWRVIPPYFPQQPPEGAPSIERYVQQLACDPRPVFELWRSQREALPQALGANPGAVVSLRTSAGKTRVAELAILQTLSTDPESKVLYLAPFRSLAFELEQSLSRALPDLEVSHLYGGARASRTDTEMVSEAAVIIATPEKARAVFRADPALFSTIKLIIIDEGHLLSSGEREVRNELYLEHLRVRARASGARLLLLSAVLPNADEIAAWIAGSAEHVAASTWRPSLQRFGMLQWNGTDVRLEWFGDTNSLNPHFVTAAPVSTRKRARLFPNNKAQAVGAAAVRLWSRDRPVMIFVSQARWVSGVAESVLEALQRAGVPVAHEWPDLEWRIFSFLCEEELPPASIELRAASAGIICHSNSLPSQVRLAMEHLMRSAPPRVIIATSTLAQGVNIGVNTVILHSTLIGQDHHVAGRDFWNIAGRAGRAFVDVEGKILFAVDETNGAAARRDTRRAREYFAGAHGDPVVSGILSIVRELRELAARARVSFAQLLEMAAEDNFAPLNDGAQRASEACDYLDDALLALHVDVVLNEDEEPPEVWIERLFRDSLAVLQAGAATRSLVRPNDVVAFVKARANAALRRAPTKEHREAIVASSLPLTVALRLFDGRETWAEMLSDYVSTNTGQELATFVARAEEWLREHGGSLARNVPDAGVLETVRTGWLAGTALRDLCGHNIDAHRACREFYGFTLTWLVHAASQQFKSLGDEAAMGLSQISLCIELGLPSEYACQIFLAGIQSRVAVAEIAASSVTLGDSIPTIRRSLRDEDTVKELRATLSPASAEWLDLVRRRSGASRERMPAFQAFRSPDGAPIKEELVARTSNGRTFLSSVDGRYCFALKSTREMPFASVSNDPRFVFRHDGDVWRLHSRDPRLSPRS